MTAVMPHAVATEGLRRLPSTLKNYAGFGEVVGALSAGRPASIDGVWGSACALVAAALAEETSGSDLLVVVAPSQREAEDLAVDIELFAGSEPAFFAASDADPGELAAGDESIGQRLRVLKGLLSKQETPRTKSREPNELKKRGTGLGRFIKTRQ